MRIVQEQVDVVAFTVIDLEHQGRAAAETPPRRETLRFLEAREDFDGDIEQDRPLAGPVFGGHAANVSLYPDSLANWAATFFAFALFTPISAMNCL